MIPPLLRWPPQRDTRALHQSLRTLAANLAIGSALCEAYQIGSYPQIPGEGKVGVSVDIWRPGCGKPAPQRAGKARGG